MQEKIKNVIEQYRDELVTQKDIDYSCKRELMPSHFLWYTADDLVYYTKDFHSVEDLQKFLPGWEQSMAAPISRILQTLRGGSCS